MDVIGGLVLVEVVINPLEQEAEACVRTVVPEFWAVGMVRDVLHRVCGVVNGLDGSVIRGSGGRGGSGPTDVVRRARATERT